MKLNSDIKVKENDAQVGDQNRKCWKYISLNLKTEVSNKYNAVEHPGHELAWQKKKRSERKFDMWK